MQREITSNHLLHGEKKVLQAKKTNIKEKENAGRN